MPALRHTLSPFLRPKSYSDLFGKRGAGQSSTSNPLGALTGVTYGSFDSDNFTYDPNTGRAGTYTLSVNRKTDAGTLTWNPNGTLRQLVINDQIPNTVDSQTCGYTYDDLVRVGGQDNNGYSVDCASSIWQQLFTYDAFGNISSSGSSNFQPTNYINKTTLYPNNQINMSGVSYDNNGNLSVDNLGNRYSWDPNWGNMTQVATATITVNATYDALGRVVEQYNGSAYQQILYSPVGKIALINGSNLTKAFLPLPGGGTAIYNSTSSSPVYYRHADWLGSSRLTSTATQGLYSSQAYAPFGQAYSTANASGSTSSAVDPNFTGQNSDTVPSLYDFPFREHGPSQGRWISPDPLGIGAVDPTNPQTWNRYAYALNNPLSVVDPLGLLVAGPGQCDGPSGDPCGGGGGAPGDWCPGCLSFGFGEIQQGLNSYLSWINSMWLLGGSAVLGPSGRGWAVYTIDWTINGGAVYVDASGRILSAELVNELGLTTLPGVDDSPDYSLGGPGGAGGGPGSGGGKNNTACVAARVSQAIPGAQFASTGNDVGGHQQTWFSISTVSAADLNALAPSAFSIFGVNNGYRFGGVFMSLHANNLTLTPTGDILFQAHIDVFNPATGLFGMLGHALVDLGIGNLFFHQRNGLDPACHS